MLMLEVIDAYALGYSHSGEVVRWPLVVLDELVALVVSVMLTLTLTLRYGEITLMQLLHAVVLSVHVVLTYI